MDNIWDETYKKNASFFGEKPSDFAVSCYHHMEDGAKTILDVGCGLGFLYASALNTIRTEEIVNNMLTKLHK